MFIFSASAPFFFFFLLLPPPLPAPPTASVARVFLFFSSLSQSFAILTIQLAPRDFTKRSIPITRKHSKRGSPNKRREWYSTSEWLTKQIEI